MTVHPPKRRRWTARGVRAPERSRVDQTLVADLERRVRELTALHKAAHLLQEDRRAEEWLEAIAAHLPTDWLAPEVVAARIVLGGTEFMSGACPPASVWQRVEFTTADGTPGAIEIITIEETDGVAGRAAEARRTLLGSLSDMLRLALDRWEARKALQRSYERIQELSGRLTDIEEAERAHLARELHDEVGQDLTALRLMLSAARTKATPDTAALIRADEMLDALIKRVREMSVALRPPHLDILGLALTLSWHVQRFTEQTNIRIALRHRGIDRRVGPRVELAVFRIVQESLTNIARHAGVAEATVRVWANDTLLFLQIEDKGKGFDLDGVDKRYGGVGLLGMQERARLLGGTLAVESAPGAGTTIRAELPLGDAAPGGEAGHDARKAP
jgi:signal transduction histidine kinase